MIKAPIKNLISASRYLLPFWRKEILILLLGLSAALISLINPYLAKLVIDQAYAQRDLKIFLILLFFAGGVFILSNALESISKYFKDYISFKVIFTFSREAFKKIQNLSYHIFQQRPSGEYLYRLSNDINQVGSFISDGLPQVIFLAFKFLFILIISLYLNWKITAFALALSPFLYVRSFLFVRLIRAKTEKLFENSENAFETAREVFSNMQLVKSFGKEKRENSRFVRQLINNIKINIANTKLNIWSQLVESWFNKLLLGLITLYGGYQIINGTLTLGTFTAIMIYINQLLGLGGSLSSLYESFVVSGISWDRLDTILSASDTDEEDKQAEEYLFPLGAIQFRGVTFGYKEERIVLGNLSFSIEGGKVIALVGSSGCGKTTMLNLIIKLYHPKEGLIFIDGRTINLIKRKSLLEQVALAFQKPLFWNDSVLNNIKYGRSNAADNEAFRAAEICCADNFINQLPNGYNTIIGESGTRLSEGQKQRIALARAIIKNPKILIIDEGMSSLDSQTEDKIISKLKQEFKETTIIVVSHRLSTIKKMDLVYFLEGADKLTIGQHEQLVKENIAYRELFASQLEEKESISR